MRLSPDRFLRLLVLASIVIATSPLAAAIRPTGESVPQEVLIRIESGASTAEVEGIQHAADADQSERLSRVGSGAIWRMRSRSKSAAAIQKALEKNPNVAYVEPNYILRAYATPDDPSYSSLWGLRNTGQVISGVTGLAGADIDAQSAWNVTTGSASVVVGVVDTGVDYNHPDLAANIWSNPGGIGRPDCAAGTHGFNAITNTCDPMDDHYHGTHVSGTIGAVGNNAAGVAGVNWTTSIMGLKFIGSNGSGTTAGAIAAIEFAVQAKIAGVNVRVLSNSWGGGSFSKALFDEINKASENDILFVASAGNDGSSNDVWAHYPSNYATANMISVAATDNRDQLAYFSNFGSTTVHLGAPGVSVYSCFPNNSYGSLSGTSMATPHVSGVAALLLAHAPGLTTAQVKSAILGNVDPIDSLAGKTVTGGRLNAARALGLPAGPDFTLSVSPASRTILRGSTASYTFTITPSNGFAGPVTLAASGLPANTTATFTPNPATTASTLTVTTSAATSLGTFSIVGTGTSGEQAHAKSVSLTTVSTLPPPICPDFSSIRTYSASYDPTAIATGDFNRDGNPDLAVAITLGNRIAVHLGTGSGTFGTASLYSVGSTPLSVAVGDFNGDGRADLASANAGANSVTVLLGTGSGGFLAPVAFSAGTNPFWLATGDFDADGQADLAVANNGSSSVSILLGNGDGTFQPPVPYTTGSGPFWVATGDLNRDGRPDLVVAAHNADQVSVLAGNGDGTFQAAVGYSAGDGPSSVTIADFDRDGASDLAVSNYASNNVSFLRGNGNGTFQAAVHQAVGSGPYAAAAFDANSDGRLDLAVPSGGSNTVTLLLGDGNGTFVPKTMPAGGTGPNHVVVADFNRDGRPDLALPHLESDIVSIVLNTGTCSMNCGSFGAASDEGTGASPDSVATADFNGDGKLDFVAANRGDDSVSVSLGNGDGTFQVSAGYGTGDSPRSVVVSDLNRDGILDLVTANDGSGTVSILPGNADGTFQGAVGHAAGTEPYAVATGDFNRDGHTDLVVANRGSDDVSILLGNGGGTFAPSVSYATGTAPEHVAAGDLDGDGNTDVVVANSGSDDVSILRGKADGTFHPAADFAAGTSPSAVVIGDFDRNGRVDLAVSNGGSDDVSILLGNGNGTLQAAVSWAAGTNPRAVAAGDFNADGLLDLAVGNHGSNDVSIRYGAGNGAFPTATTLGAGTGPSAIAAGDLDRDGRPDLAVANDGSAEVSVLINGCPIPDLTVALSHSGTFAQGDTGRTYTIVVTNSGTGPTDGPVSVTDTLPVGLSATSMSGTGWTCNSSTLVCTREDVLAGGASYPPVTLTVKVATNAPPTVTNAVTVAGGFEINVLNSSASDPTSITQVTGLTITKSHPGSFAQGATGTFTIVVRNAGGAPTSGTVTVTDTLPSGLTATAIAGTGWTCALGSLTCTRSDVLAGGAGYPSITVTVNVASNAPGQVVNTATVSGGGDASASDNTASDPTTIWSSTTCGGFGLPVHYPAQSDPYAVVSGDFDEDGKVDLATTNVYSDSVSVLRGNGDGTFAPAVHAAVGRYPRELTVTDLNNDGHEDLAVVNHYSDSVSILLGNGNATFTGADSVATASYPQWLTAGDFNGDGAPDLAVGSTYGLSVHLGNGNGSLQPGLAVNLTGYARSVSSADFDGDGKLDLVVANGTDSVATFKGNGDGTFQSPVSHTASYDPNRVVAGDLNADGKVDLVVAHSYSSQLAVLIGNGNATFQAPVLYPSTYGSGTFLVIEDLSGDGISDIASTSTYSYSVGVLRGNGNGTFQPVSEQPTGFSSTAFVVSDFNGDGKPDLGMTNTSQDALSVLLGGCADLTIAKTHSGNFKGGQTSAQYTLTVTNSGGGSTVGPITVTDTLPAGLTATSIYGSGWSCTLATLTCTRSEPLGPGASAPIALLVNVALNAPTSVVNTATVSGGGDGNAANNTASDPTTIIQGPDLTVSTNSNDAFPQGKAGAIYTVTVTNAGNQPTSGTVTLTDTVFAYLTPTAIAGPGWNCALATLTCTRSDALPANVSYPSIVLTVNVSASATDVVTNTVTVSGGGDTTPDNNSAFRVTKILTPPANVVATPISSSQVQITWNAVTHAASYEVYRLSPGGVFSYVGYSYTNGLVNTSVTPGTAYLYRVVPLSSSGFSGPVSGVDLATAVMFTDTSILPGVTPVRKAHLTELRTAVNAVRALASLPAATFTDPTLTSVPLKAIHFTELRTALNAARTALALPAVVYTDPALAAGTAPKAAHLLNLRNGVQ